MPGGRRWRLLPGACSQTPLLPAELHKTILLTSSWPHCHFPKALYFYRELDACKPAPEAEKERVLSHPRMVASSYYPPLPGPPRVSASQLSQKVETGLI